MKRYNNRNGLMTRSDDGEYIKYEDYLNEIAVMEESLEYYESADADEYFFSQHLEHDYEDGLF